MGRGNFALDRTGPLHGHALGEALSFPTVIGALRSLVEFLRPGLQKNHGADFHDRVGALFSGRFHEIGDAFVEIVPAEFFFLKGGIQGRIVHLRADQTQLVIGAFDVLDVSVFGKRVPGVLLSGQTGAARAGEGLCQPQGRRDSENTVLP